MSKDKPITTCAYCEKWHVCMLCNELKELRDKYTWMLEFPTTKLGEIAESCQYFERTGQNSQGES